VAAEQGVRGGGVAGGADAQGLAQAREAGASGPGSEARVKMNFCDNCMFLAPDRSGLKPYRRGRCVKLLLAADAISCCPLHQDAVQKPKPKGGGAP
jgi:hypothetical protein